MGESSESKVVTGRNAVVLSIHHRMVWIPFLVLLATAGYPVGLGIAFGVGIGPNAESPKYDNTLAKDFIMDAPWRVIDEHTAIPVTIVLKDCDVDDIRELHWIRMWDITGGGSTLLWDHDFGDETIGDDPSEENFWTYVTTVTEGHAVLPDGTLLTPANLGYGPGSAVDLEVSVYYRDDWFNYTDTRVLRVHVGSGPFPWPDDWYGGDTHYHTMYTNNLYEFGVPLPAVQASAAAMGLHWLVATDHSCDLDETGDGIYSYGTRQWEYTIQSPSGIQTVYRDVTAYGSSWASLGADVADLDSPDVRLYRGVEINLSSVDGDSWEKTLHTLFYNPDYIHSPLSGAIGERPVHPSLTDGLNMLAATGFAYAAHPLDDLAAEWAGLDLGVNGTVWGDEDYVAALGNAKFRGVEAFNTRATRYSSDQNNPWSDFDAGVSPDDPYPNGLLAGIDLWDQLLRANLAPGEPRKVFFSGGSDAHGDMNYASHMSLDNYATDNALGKVQTVVYVPGGYAPGNLPPMSEILDALRNGRSVVTDGPFLEMGLDRDGDGDWTEAGDLMIGDDGSVDPSVALPLHLRWASFPEFGPVVSVRLLAGSGIGTSTLITFDPTGSGQGYEGSSTIDLSGFDLDGPHYVRAELATDDGDAGHRAYTNPIWMMFEETTDVADLNASPCEEFDLRIAPNPFNPEAEIEFSLPYGTPARTTLSIYDARGRRIRRLVDAEKVGGVHRVLWDGTDEAGTRVASGLYFCRLCRNGENRTERLVLLR